MIRPRPLSVTIRSIPLQPYPQSLPQHRLSTPTLRIPPGWGVHRTIKTPILSRLRRPITSTGQWGLSLLGCLRTSGQPMISSFQTVFGKTCQRKQRLHAKFSPTLLYRLSSSITPSSALTHLHNETMPFLATRAGFTELFPVKMARHMPCAVSKTFV